MFHVKHRAMPQTDPMQFVPADRRPLLIRYGELLKEWNSRINLVSRSSVDTIATRHIPHCLALASRSFRSGTTVVDWGTGGGLPSVPLAIAFPGVQFVGVDSTGKKVRAVREMISELGLDNVTVAQVRAESWDGTAQYAVSRATASLADLWRWTVRASAFMGESKPGTKEWPSSLICLKGGDLSDEHRALPPGVRMVQTPIVDMLGPGYEDKYIVQVMKSDGRTRRRLHG